MASTSGTVTTRMMKVSITKAIRRFQKPTYSTVLGAAGAGAVSGELDELFSKVLPLEQADESLRRVLQAVRDGFPVFYFAAGNPPDQLGQRLSPKLHPVGDDKALDLDAVGEDRLEAPHAVRLRGVVLRNETAYRDARKSVHAPQDSVKDLPADVLEIAIDTVGYGRLQVLVELYHLVVDAAIETELLHDIAALLFAAGDAD